MMTHFSRNLAALICLAFLSAASHAVNFSTFTEETFKQLQADGASILVDVRADWCPTCAKQKKVLNAYAEANPDYDLNVLFVDFDSQKEWVKHFKAPRQSTFILFKGEEQLWFSVAETRKKKIFANLDEAK